MNNYKYRWWMLIVATISQMCAALSTQGIGVFVGFFQHDFALSNSAVGLLVSMLNIAPIFGMFFLGGVLDRIGERLPIFFGMIIIASSLFLMAYASHYWQLLIILFICGIGYSPIQPGGSKAIYNWFNSAERGFAMGVRQAALPIGGAFAAVILPFIIHASSWRVAEIIAAIIIMIGSILFVTIYRNHINSRVSNSRSSYKYVLEILSGKNADVFFITIIGMVLVAIQTAILIFWVLFINQHFSIPLLKCIRYLFIIQIFGALGRISLASIGGIATGYSRKIMLLIVIMLIVLLMIISFLPSTANLNIVMLLSCFLGFFGFGWYGPWIVWLAEKAVPDKVGATISASMILNQVAIVLTPLIFGVIVDITKGYIVAWGCLAAILAILSLQWKKIK